MTPEIAAELAQANLTYQLALARVGAYTIAEALALWNHLPNAERAVTSSVWIKTVTKLIIRRRRQSADLTRAHYRLVRALNTGTTVDDWTRAEEPTSVTLGELRKEFNQVVDLVAGSPVQDVSAVSQAQTSTSSDSAPGGQSDGATGDREPGHDDHHNGDDQSIAVERIAKVAEELAALDKDAESEIAVVLQALGLRNLQKKLDAIDTSAPAKQVDVERETARKQAGARQASAAERIALNGGRSTNWALMSNDNRVIGWARVSQTGTPCGWCAMLISRGAVYKSDKSAEYADGDAYHDNCHCIAVPVYSTSQFAQDATFDLNRSYREQWPTVTRGLSGKAAVSAWRAFIRQQNKPDAPAA